MPELGLPLVLSSVGAGRRWVESSLAEWSDDGRQAAMLVASELIANVVLHARTEAVLTLDVTGDCARISVADRDPRLPAVKEYSDDAPTGRGLRLVGRLATDWGFDRHPHGKSVWAVVCDRSWPAGPPSGSEPGVRPTPAQERSTAAPAAGTEARETVEIRLLGVPLDTLRKAQEHTDELIREFAFLAGSRHLSSRLDALAREVEGHFDPVGDGVRTEIERAAAGGWASVDLKLGLSRAGWAAVQAFADLLEEADEYCDRVELLTLASLPAVRRLRRWYTDEIGRQMAGGDPGRWPGA